MDISELNDNDVMSVSPYASPLPGSTFKVHEFKHVMQKLHYKMFDGVGRWIGNGVDCEILDSRTGGWKKGKFRIQLTMEFIPNDSET